VGILNADCFEGDCFEEYGLGGNSFVGYGFEGNCFERQFLLTLFA
jgi:hypothetical protein